jgi:ketosteroid isomerase-like protein
MHERRSSTPVNAVEPVDPVPALRAALQMFLDAIDRADLAALASLWRTDATMYFPFANSPAPFHGRDAILARFERMFTDLRARTPGGPPYVGFRVLAFECTPLDERHVLACATLAFGRELGRRTIVFAREPAGWRLLHVHASNMADRAAGQRLAADE